MWKRLKRMWSSDGDARDTSGHDGPSLSRAEPEIPVEPEPPDPMLERLQDYDEVHDRRMDQAPAHLRELLLDAPTDPRVLRRAAALMAELGDEDLAEAFQLAARSSQDLPLVMLAESFLGMEDPELALAFADGAVARAAEQGADSEGRLVGALVLARQGAHPLVLDRLGPALARGGEGTALVERVRYAISALLSGELEAYGAVRGTLGEAEGWLEEVATRVGAFPSNEDEDQRQRLLFALYGALLLDDANDGEALSAARLARWMEALAALARALLPEGTRPAWVGPRGEVLARWLGALLPENAAMPLSARLPRQPVLVMLADDAELATLVEAGLTGEASSLPMFQALKDPGELGSPMADVIGVFRGGATLPFGPLDAERTSERLTPRMLVGRLQDEARAAASDAGEGAAGLSGFLAWARERESLMSLTRPTPLEARLPLDPSRL